MCIKNLKSRKIFINIFLLLTMFINSYSQTKNNSLFTHTFQYQNHKAKNVSVVGAFNDWDIERGKMVKVDSNTFEKDITMDRGSHLYAFIVDGVFTKDPNNNDFKRKKINNTLQWVSRLWPPNDDDKIIFPEELEDDIKNIKYEFLNAPPFYYFKKTPKKVIERDLYPELYIELPVKKDFSNVEFEFSIYNNKGEILKKYNRIVSSWKKLLDLKFGCFESPLINPSYFIFKLKANGKEYSFRKDYKTYKLYGKVTTYSDNIIDSAYVIVHSNNFLSMASYCDTSGHYQMELQEGIYRRNWANDKLYTDKHLENYFIDLVLDKDTEMNFKIGELEVYQLNVAPISETNVIQGQFIVWSISSIRNYNNSTTASNHTPIKKDEVKIFLNDVMADLIILSPIKRLSDYLKPNKDGWYFEAVIPDKIRKQKKREPNKFKRNELKVVVEHHSTDENGNPIVEKGQAQFLNLYWQ